MRKFSFTLHSALCILHSDFRSLCLYVRTKLFHNLKHLPLARELAELDVGRAVFDLVALYLFIEGEIIVSAAEGDQSG